MIKGALTRTGAKGLGGELPGQVFYGIQGPAGPKGDDYVLTDTDKAEIAEMAAELVEVPDSAGNLNVSIDGEILVIAENSTATIENETLIL